MTIRHITQRMALALAGLLAFSGCATGPVFQGPEAAPKDAAQLYVYRPVRMAGGGTSNKISVDSRSDTLSLPNGSWQRVLLAPGTHTVSVRDYFNTMYCGPFPLTLQLLAGQTTYVENLVGLSGVAYSGTVALSQTGCSVRTVPEEQALKELASLRGAQ